MKYFKIITDDQIVGVITSSNFRYINPTNGWLLTSNENLGQLVSYKNKLYRDYWMQPITINIYSYIVAQVQEITLEEYEALNTAVKINAVVIEEAEKSRWNILYSRCIGSFGTFILSLHGQGENCQQGQQEELLNRFAHNVNMRV